MHAKQAAPRAYLDKARSDVRSSWHSYIVVDVALDVVEPEGSLIVGHGGTRLCARYAGYEAEVVVCGIGSGAGFALLSRNIGGSARVSVVMV